jgi:predicted GNAT family N-acyltransferase
MKIKIVESNEEKEQAFHVRTVVFVDEQKVSIEEEIDEHEDEAIHFIGYEDKSPIAASRLRWVDNYGKLERICILKNYRGKSYGSQLIKAMEAKVTSKGYTQTKLNAQTRAIDFYKQHGYQVVSDEFLDAGIPHVTMTKQFI